MKEIIAYIKPHKLIDVTRALKKVKRLRGMSVVEVKGFGRREENATCYSIIDDLFDFSEYSKIEIYCDDDLVDELVSLINENATTGMRGDGKIYVCNVDRAFKIGRGEIE